jgi:hypothetical protein
MTKIVPLQALVRASLNAPKKLPVVVARLPSTAPPSVIRLVEDVLEQRAKKEPYFRPSMIGGCSRQNVLHYVGAPTNPSYGINPFLHKILDTGTALHEVIQGYLSEHPGVYLVKEVPVHHPELKIKGHSDGLLIDRKTGNRWVLEIKTTGASKFAKISRPEPHHQAQASTYARLLGVEWAVILYWSRDNGMMKEFPVQALQSWEEVKERVQWLLEYAEAIEDPSEIREEELPEFDAKECRASVDFCSFSDVCTKIRERGERGNG